MIKWMLGEALGAPYSTQNTRVVTSLVSQPVNPWSLSSSASTQSSRPVSSTSCIWKTCNIKPCAEQEDDWNIGNEGLVRQEGLRLCPTGCSLLRICKTFFKPVVSQVSSCSLRKFSFAGKKGDRAVTVLEAILSEEWSKKVKIHKAWSRGTRVLSSNVD